MSQNRNLVQNFLLSLAACLFLYASQADAQRARFEGTGIDDFFSLQSQPQPATLPPPPQNLSFPGVAAQNPPSIITTQPQIIGQGAPAAPSFDPFATGNQAFPVFPTAPQPGPPPVQSFRDVTGAQPGFNYASPQGYAPNNWPYAGTGTDWLPSIDWTWANQTWEGFKNNFLPRVLERPRVRQTWIYGSSGDASIGNELGINDLEFATTATWPRFLGGPQPLRISPGFAAHWWKGPDSAVTGADLPARAYSAYLAFDHTTDPSSCWGMDNNFTIGYYSDFNQSSSNSLRYTGRLVGWRRMNDYLVGKFGVEYFDRIRVKLLPVFGFYANPNPDMKIDLTFPRSKVSHRIPNFNNYEGWVYVGAEYGGGSWGIERAAGFKDQVDINDVRAFTGFEWMGPRRVTGFFDVGYVFERELVYRSAPMIRIPIQDSFMLRFGLAF